MLFFLKKKVLNQQLELITFYGAELLLTTGVEYFKKKIHVVKIIPKKEVINQLLGLISFHEDELFRNIWFEYFPK